MRKMLLRTSLASLVVVLAALAGALVPGGRGVALASEASGASRPNTAIHGGPRGTTSSRRASFHLLGTRGAVRIQCKLDRGRWYLCARSSSKYVTLRNLRRGSHTFSARAVNRAGRVDPTPARRTWRIR